MPLSAEEREHLQTLIGKGKSPAKRLLKARILLKADVSEAGDGWSDSRIIKALDTSASMIYRVRKQLVEEGFEAVLSRKRRMTPPVAAIFDGEKEAKLIALACSKPPQDRARWTLRLLETKVVKLGIAERASDSTIGRTSHGKSTPDSISTPADGWLRTSFHSSAVSRPGLFSTSVGMTSLPTSCSSAPMRNQKSDRSSIPACRARRQEMSATRSQ